MPSTLADAPECMRPLRSHCEITNAVPYDGAHPRVMAPRISTLVRGIQARVDDGSIQRVEEDLVTTPVHNLQCPTAATALSRRTPYISRRIHGRKTNPWPSGSVKHGRTPGCRLRANSRRRTDHGGHHRGTGRCGQCGHRGSTLRPPTRIALPRGGASQNMAGRP